MFLWWLDLFSPFSFHVDQQIFIFNKKLWLYILGDIKSQLYVEGFKAVDKFIDMLFFFSFLWKGQQMGC